MCFESEGSSSGRRLYIQLWYGTLCIGIPNLVKVKLKVIPQQAEVAHGVPVRLSPRIFLTFSTTRVVGRQPYAPAAFTPKEIPGTHFQRLRRPQGTWFRRGGHGKNPQ
jgi:hypothetical protein